MGGVSVPLRFGGHVAAPGTNAWVEWPWAPLPFGSGRHGPPPRPRPPAGTPQGKLLAFRNPFSGPHLEVGGLTFCGWCGANVPPHHRVCPRCARPLGVPYLSLPSDPRALLAGALVIVAILVLLVIGAVLSPPAPGLIDGPTVSKPAVTLAATKIAGGADILVAGIQPTEPPGDFEVNMEDATTTTFGTAVGVPTSPGGRVSVTVGSGVSLTAFSIQWQNPGGSGRVSQGDHFVIEATGAYTPGIMYSFVLIWRDGSTLTSISWIA